MELSGKCLLCNPVYSHRVTLLKHNSDIGIVAGSFEFFIKTTHSVEPGVYSVFFWSLHVFLVFHRDALLCSLSGPFIQKRSKEKLLWKFWEKFALGKLLFSKAASCMVTTCNFTLNKVLTILTLSFSLINLSEFTFCFITEA